MENELLKPLEILDMLQSRKCVCGHVKEPMKSHCWECYQSLPPEKRKALYRRFGKGYEAAFLDSLQFLVGEGRTTIENIRDAVPVKAEK